MLTKNRLKQPGINLWLGFGLAKIALQAGSKIYANRQRAKVAMSDAQLLHAERQARGEEDLPGKITRSETNRS